MTGASPSPCVVVDHEGLVRDLGGRRWVLVMVGLFMARLLWLAFGVEGHQDETIIDPPA